MTIYQTTIEYYVYAYIRKDGSPYYIGKGKGKRAYQKQHGVAVPKDRFRIVFLERNLTNVGACALERRYIEWYGRKINNTGILRNITEGGEGNTGPRSKFWRKNHSKMMMGNKPSKETIQKLKNFDRSYMKTSKYRNKMSELKKGFVPKSRRIVITPLGIFKCRKFAAQKYGVCEASISYWIRTKRQGFYFLT